MLTSFIKLPPNQYPEDVLDDNEAKAKLKTYPEKSAKVIENNLVLSFKCAL